ncbi:uncharacterized protein G2W53_025584 [Senna tora]|uniref:Uncharacterized protein n=1 Tax=Senna tora TaxID=362788 RepID=A0A834WKE7_9FABA|nr:uncharacterized protein G2W53_025584 [Senna tora]
MDKKPDTNVGMMMEASGMGVL